MKPLFARSTVLPLLASVLLAACADSTAPTPRVLAVAPSAAVIGGPNLSDFRSFSGQLWVCPDTPGPGTGFYFKWSIVDNATSLVVASGTVANASAQQCLNLGSVPTNVRGRYTATVKEDPGNPYKLQSISASYGSNLPIAAPTPTINLAKKTISSLMSNDFGVLFTFHH